MINCSNPRIIINQGVYEAVAFSKYIIMNGIQHSFFGISKLNISPLYDVLKEVKKTVGQECLDLYYTFDRFGFKIPLFIAVPCNHCELCQLRDSNIISQRCQFESEMHSQLPWFITLTFAPLFHPKDNKCRKHHIQMYLKRLRSYIDYHYNSKGYNINIRYYAQGEYGDSRGRMHYHLLIFGLPAISYSSALCMFKSCWRSNRFYSFLKGGKIIKYRPLIGRVGVSQINSPEYRQYYKKKTGRELKPEDGIRYCCSYSTKDSLVRTWSLGLGKSFVEKFLKPDVRKNNPCYDLQWTNRFNKTQPVILSRWFLNVCFKTFNRSSYYLRSSLVFCFGSSLYTRDYKWYFNKLKPALTSLLGITTLYKQPFINCFDYLIYHRKLFNPCNSFKSLVSVSRYSRILDNFLDFDFDFYRNETIAYKNYITNYFSNIPERSYSDVRRSEYSAKKYYNMRKQLLISL